MSVNSKNSELRTGLTLLFENYFEFELLLDLVCFDAIVYSTRPQSLKVKELSSYELRHDLYEFIFQVCAQHNIK